jgi:hypothetical protein
VIAYPWDAGTACGVTYDRRRSQRAAAGALREGKADVAVVTEARADLGTATLVSGYTPTGKTWRGRLRSDGPWVRWRQARDVR